MAKLTITAPAKLNLFLHINGRRPDGYHNLQTVFQLLDFGDQLHFSLRRDNTITLRCEGPHSLADLVPEDNLVLRAADMLKKASSEHDALPGVDITLQKHLPTGGGLGGGSSDAASTLLALNQLWKLDLDIEHLASLGRKLGADVPVFVKGYSAWAEGIGDLLTPLDLPERWYLVVTPDCHVATPEVFSHPELTRDTPAITMAAFFTGPTRNDCEPVVRRVAGPVDKLLKVLGKFGAPRMTGSGASVFVSCATENEARRLSEQLPQSWQQFVARGVNHSPALAALSG